VTESVSLATWIIRSLFSFGYRRKKREGEEKGGMIQEKIHWTGLTPLLTP
jgi:hypothetical protein